MRSKWSRVLRKVISFSTDIPDVPSGIELTEIMEAGKHAVMATKLGRNVDQSSNTISTMYNYLRQFEKGGATLSKSSHSKRRKSLSSCSDSPRRRSSRGQVTQV